MSSRLFQSIREKHGLAYSVDCDVLTFSQAGIFTFFFALHPRNVTALFRILKEELLRLKHKDITHVERERVRSQIRGSLLLANEHMDVRCESIAHDILTDRPHESTELRLQKFMTITASDVRSFAQHTFQESCLSLLVCGKRSTGISYSWKGIA